MANLVLAALGFAVLHLLVSGTALRGQLVKRLGEGPYRGLFSLGSVLGIVWLRRAYGQAYATDNHFFWALPYAQHWAGPVMLVALLLAVPGLAGRSPTAVGQEGVLLSDPEPRGMQRITRHPFLWGVMLWSAFHLAANGDSASIVLFATFLVVAAVGTRSIDAKRARALGPRWDAYLARTSNLPFAAIVSGRTQLVMGEIGAWRLLLSAAVFGGLVWLHPLLFHAAALPGQQP